MLRLRVSKIRYQGTRHEQQDNVTVLDVSSGATNFAVGVLTDGIGGLAHGAQASALVNQFVSTALPQLGAASDWSDSKFFPRMAALVRDADDALRSFRTSAGIGRCGTTLVVAVIGNNACRFVSVGDSMIYAVDRTGHVTKLNTAQVARVGERAALTSAIMGEDMVQIDTGTIDLRATDTCGILLSSDGLLSLSTGEIAAELRAESPAKLRRLVERIAALERSVQDNISMILFEIEDAA